MQPRLTHKGWKCVGKGGGAPIKSNHVSACTCVGKVRKDINWKKSVKHTCQTERSRLTVNANISLIFAGLPLNGTDSINCKHLGGLQALHLDPQGSSPGTGGPAQHKSRSERGDYLLSPRRDMGTGILSDSFTLIIRTGWQDGESADSYRKCFMKNTTAVSKKTFPKFQRKGLQLRHAFAISVIFPPSLLLCDKSNQHCAGVRATRGRKRSAF